MKKFMLNFFRDEEGLTTVEYAIAGGLIAAALVTVFTDIGKEALEKLEALLTALET
jgi:pilus assembly protein Flp/PilA